MAKSLQPCYVRLTALILFVCLPFWCDAAPYSTFNSSLDGGALYLPRQVAKQATGRIMFPDQMSEAAIEPFHIFPRGISQDPSCPAGFLCDLEACPASVECQPGDSCFNFEGTIVCGSPALQWCAFNPSTFEAVGCTSGQCCHGNCYTSDAVCCDFPSIQCAIGKLCNACNPGQTCSNNECIGDGSPPPPPPPSMTTTTKPTTTQSTTTEPTTTQSTTTKSTKTQSTTTKPTTTQSTTTKQTSTTTSSSSSSSVTQVPTLVPSVGTFANVGCFVDSTTARVLIASSSVDQSATGMTVEKCLAFAQQGSWRFGGVEFGGECFVGNTMHSSTGASQDNCNQPCAGNNAEECGQGNRVQIYEDSTWFDPTAAELAIVLQEYNNTLVEASEALSAYQSHIEALQTLEGQSKKSKVRRQSQTETILLQEIRSDSQSLNRVQQLLDQAAQQGGRLFVIASNDDIDRTTAPLVDTNILNELQGATSGASSSFAEVVSAAAEDAASIADSTTPLLNVAGDLAVTGEAAAGIGIPAAGAAATGFFLVIATLFDFFSGPSSSPPPTTTTTSISSSSSSTSSSTTSSTVCNICTAINGAVSQPTPILEQQTKRDDEYEIPGLPELSSRSLEKRAGRIYNPGSVSSYGISSGNFQTTFDFCPNNLFTWHALKYPSTSSASNQAPQTADGGEENTNDGSDDSTLVTITSAPDIPGIGMFGNGPFVDVQYLYSTNSPADNNGVQATICGYQIAGFPDRFASTNDFNYRVATNKQAEQNYYDTEHVFELHMIKDFFVWLFVEGHLTCDGLQAIFGGNDNAANMLMAQLAWYDPVAQTGTLNELFVVNRGLNHLKGAIMHGRPLGEVESDDGNRVLPRPTTWFGCHDLLGSTIAVFQFLGQRNVITAFTNARDRISSFLSDPSRFFEINDAPTGTTFAGLWEEWLDAWITKRQSDVLAWRMEVQTTCQPFAVVDPCWQASYDNLFENAYPADSFTFPADWLSN